MIDLSKIKSLMIETDGPKLRIRFRDIHNKMGRISPKDHPEFKTKDEAKNWVKTYQAYLAGEKARVNRIVENNRKFPHVQEKLKLYINYKTEKKVKEILTIEAYFQNYVFHYFLSEKGCLNILEWPLHYEGFLKHLGQVISKKGSPLAIETQRKICFYFNDFLNYLNKKKLTQTYIEKIEVPSSVDNALSIKKAYWTSEEIEKVKPFLSDDSFRLLILGIDSGMRIGELLNVTRFMYYNGNISKKEIHEKLLRAGIEYKGYIKLDSQINKIENGLFSIKPLKGKNEISQKYARYVPVSLRSYEIVKYFNNKIFALGNILPNDSNNLFWSNLNKSKINLEIQNACRSAGIPVKTTHATRHTFCTNFLMTTTSEFLTKLITGHTSDKAFKRYLHLIESLEDVNNQNKGLLD